VITNEEKLACVKRELRMREYVYPRRVSMGSMTQETADREIAIIKAIVADYTAQVEKEEAVHPALGGYCDTLSAYMRVSEHDRRLGGAGRAAPATEARRETWSRGCRDGT
jgi:hypothetical protein